MSIDRKLWKAKVKKTKEQISLVNKKLCELEKRLLKEELTFAAGTTKFKILKLEARYEYSSYDGIWFNNKKMEMDTLLRVLEDRNRYNVVFVEFDEEEMNIQFHRIYTIREFKKKLKSDYLENFILIEEEED